MITMLIAPFSGEMVGDELNNKKMVLGNSLVETPCRQALRGAKTTPLSLKWWRFGTPRTPPRHANDTFDTRHFWGAKKKIKSIASVASDNKDEMYIPGDPKQVEKRHFDTPSLRGAITATLGMCWYWYIIINIFIHLTEPLNNHYL